MGGRPQKAMTDNDNPLVAILCPRSASRLALAINTARVISDQIAPLLVELSGGQCGIFEARAVVNDIRQPSDEMFQGIGAEALVAVLAALTLVGERRNECRLSS